MDQQDIKYLFRKYLDNQCSASELDQVFQLLQTGAYDDLIRQLIGEEEWTNIKGQMSEQSTLKIQKKLQESMGKSRSGQSFMIQPWMIKAAASLLLFIVATIIVLQFTKTDYQEFSTSFGQTRMIELPDQSVVTLNANSKLKFRHKWSTLEDRMVYLEGEAYFDITKDDLHQTKFIVATEMMKVEVLGTRFNVQNRSGYHQVVLNHGQVKVTVPALSQHGEMMMEPGDLVEISSRQKELVKRKVNTEKYTAWMDNKLVFDSTPVYEIIKRLEDIHGIELIIQEQETLNQRFTGTYPMDNYMIVIKVLAETYDLNYRQEGESIVMSENNN
ncbi:MAG: FecR family protein [Candidatus Cyclobacteriaceae bacterium M3_2C_046]